MFIKVSIADIDLTSWSSPNQIKDAWDWWFFETRDLESSNSHTRWI